MTHYQLEELLVKHIEDINKLGENTITMREAIELCKAKSDALKALVMLNVQP